MIKCIEKLQSPIEVGIAISMAARKDTIRQTEWALKLRAAPQDVPERLRNRCGFQAETGSNRVAGTLGEDNHAIPIT